MEKYKEIFKTLKLDINEFSDIYKYAPVFKGKLDNQVVVLKKTKKQNDRGQKLLAYQDYLNRNGLAVVSAIEYAGNKHHHINDENWVFYPFIEGEIYTGSNSQIQAAGAYLGKLHSLSIEIFNHGFSWDSFDEEFLSDVKDDYEGITEQYGKKEKLFVLIQNAEKAGFEDLKKLDLTYADGTWDYKASNLIFNMELTLIDSDNSGFIPRIIDLTTALLLFNTECETAPPRPFNVEEWGLFMKGYKEHVKLTEVEVASFNEILKFSFLDEGLYAIGDMCDDESTRQKEFIRTLLDLDLDAYTI